MMAKKMSPLHMASISGEADAIRSLLATSAGKKALQQKDSLGRTPLYLAVCCNQVDAASQLLRAHQGGLAAKAIYKDKLSLLHLAISCGSATTVQQLVTVLGQIGDSNVSAALSRVYDEPGVGYDMGRRRLVGTPSTAQSACTIQYWRRCSWRHPADLWQSVQRAFMAGQPFM